MNDKKEIEDYVSGNKPLPATFTTGFKRDLDTARDIVRARQGTKPDTVDADPLVDNPVGVLEVQYN